MPLIRKKKEAATESALDILFLGLIIHQGNKKQCIDKLNCLGSMNSYNT